MKILVTGGGGYIGSHLLAMLSGEGHEIQATTRRNAPRDDGGVTWVYADLSQPGWTENISIHPEVVIHLAQSRQYRSFPDGAADMVAVNTMSTFELAEWCRKNNTKRLIYAGTGSVYAASESSLTETSPVKAASMYAASKLAAEQFLAQYTDFLEIQLCRLFTVYGPGQQDMLISNLISSIREGREITLAGGVGPTLSPTHVSDVCRVLKALISRPMEARLDVLNIAGSERITLLDLVGRLGDILGKKPLLKSVEGLPAEVSSNNDKMRQLVPDLLSLDALSSVAGSLP